MVPRPRVTRGLTSDRWAGPDKSKTGIGPNLSAVPRNPSIYEKVIAPRREAQRVMVQIEPHNFADFCVHFFYEGIVGQRRFSRCVYNLWGRPQNFQLADTGFFRRLPPIV